MPNLKLDGPSFKAGGSVDQPNTALFVKAPAQAVAQELSARATPASRQPLAQGGRVVNGRLHLDDGGSAGGDPGTGDPGASGVGVGDVGTSAPSAAGDPGVGDPGVMGVAQGQIGTSQPAPPSSNGSGLMNFITNLGLNIVGHAVGAPAGMVGLGLAAAHGSAPAAGSSIGSTIGATAGSALGPAGTVAGGIIGGMIGNAVGNMPGVPAGSVPADPTGASAAVSAPSTSSIGMSALAALSPSQRAAYEQAMAQNLSDPMGTRRLLGNPGSGSPAVYGQAPGNWGMGLRSGWASGGAIPHAQVRLLGGPLSRGAGRMNG